MVRPEVVFLDEPTTGLDPRSRQTIWDLVAGFKELGISTLLTTQYLEEADQLAQQIVVIDHGLVIAQGTAEQLKDQIGGDRIEISIVDAARAGDALAAIREVASGEPLVEGLKISAPVSGGSTVLVEAVRALDAQGVEVSDLVLRRPTLDDVFLSLTGHVAEEEKPAEKTKRGRSRS